MDVMKINEVVSKWELIIKKQCHPEQSEGSHAY